ncbi:nuclear pore complex protein Nup50-like [Amphiura filiformis]|uniref:nuclear pore complex protein Nup50-like n=1 Tax=Amphiura filiformis TaxID=82378 RepID=UPI003B20DB29
MSKRRAGTELTHDNWDQEEEEQEEAGVFVAADKNIIAKREIKKAKRRFAGGETQATDSSSSPFAAFQGFSGFGATAATSKKPDLAFGGRENKTKVALTPAENTAPVISAFVIKTSPEPTRTSTTSSKSLNGNGPSSTSSSSVFQANMNPEYSSQLRSLNQSVSAWIQQHVNANPLCDLTPVFEDYKKHLQEIETKYPEKEKTEAKGSGDASKTSTSSSSTTASSTSLAGFSFTKSTTTTTTSASSVSAPFSFKPTPAAGTLSSSSSGFSFSKSSTTSEPSAGGAVGQVKPFSFGLAQATTSSGTEAAKPSAGDEDEPPKVEFKQVEEKDAVYSKRCKLFYKKDGSFKDRGVGMLHIKKIGDRGQMLLRADTNLGNVILNVGIHPKMPATRQGKNNVMIMTAMNPPLNEKCPKCNKKYPQPQESNKCESDCTPDVEPLLLRVKTGEDADQLLEEINKLKD